jgi:hypothetical protein
MVLPSRAESGRVVLSTHGVFMLCLHGWPWPDVLCEVWTALPFLGRAWQDDNSSRWAMAARSMVGLGRAIFLFGCVQACMCIWMCAFGAGSRLKYVHTAWMARSTHVGLAG